MIGDLFLPIKGHFAPQWDSLGALAYNPEDSSVYVFTKYNWIKIGGAAGLGTVTQVSTTYPLTGGPINTTGAVAIPKATTSASGYLDSTDWDTFNSKQAYIGDSVKRVFDSLLTRVRYLDTQIMLQNYAIEAQVLGYLALKVNYSDSGSAYYSVYGVDTAKETLRSLIALRELLSNKVTNFSSPDNTTYPTTAAVNNLVSAYVPKGDSGSLYITPTDLLENRILLFQNGNTAIDFNVNDIVTIGTGTFTLIVDNDDGHYTFGAFVSANSGVATLNATGELGKLDYDGSSNSYLSGLGTWETIPGVSTAFLKIDSNTLGNAITLTYGYANYYPLNSNPSGYLTATSISGKVNFTDTAAMLTPYLRKADSNFNSGYETYYHSATTYQPIGSYLQLLDTVNNVSTRSWRQKGIDSVMGIIATYFPADTTISAAYTLTSRDFHRTIHCTNGSNIALTIPTGLGTTFECVVLAEGAGTVTPTTSSTTFYYQPTSTTKIKSQGGATIRSWATANSYLIIGSLE